MSSLYCFNPDINKDLNSPSSVSYFHWRKLLFLTEAEVTGDEVEEAEPVELLPIHFKRCSSVLDYSNRSLGIT